MYIYKITNNKNGKIYIGQTTRTVEERFAEHCRKSNTLIDRAIQKYGSENFTVETICEADNDEELNKLEIEYISKYDSMNKEKGYNLCEGGNNTKGFHHSENSKHKMSVAKSEMYVGEGNPFYHKHHTEEQKAKWSRERKGRQLTEEWKENISKSLYKPVINLDTSERFESVKSAAESCGAQPTQITRVCKGKRNRCRGYRWAYDNTVPSSK